VKGANPVDNPVCRPYDEPIPSTAARSSSRVTDLLLAWREGDPAALDRLMPIVYDEMRRLARRHMRRERPGQTLQTTALVNEAYLRLVGVRRLQWQDRAHFFAMAARTMRRVLVEAARARRRQKRGGAGRAERVTLDEALLVAPDRGPDMVALDDALDQLAAIAPRKGQVVELRYFGGLSVEETADVLQVSGDTVRRDWRLAKAWLFRELKKSHDDA
jgi:RNA polymerase sigma-70 factor (ECF subfamily)